MQKQQFEIPTFRHIFYGNDKSDAVERHSAREAAQTECLGFVYRLR